MLIEFSFSNFKSFKELQFFSMVAANIKSKHPQIDVDNVFNISKNVQLLKSKAIYGANASGKSNFVKALFTMINLICFSVKDEDLLAKSIKPFELGETYQEPTFFQIIFYNKSTIYRYGFEIKNNKIISEWLFGSPKGREAQYFIRDQGVIKVNKTYFREAKKFDTLLGDNNEIFRENSLFLSAVSVMGGKLAKTLITQLSQITIIGGLNDSFLKDIVENRLESSYKSEILEFLKTADLGIEDIGVINDEKLLEETSKGIDFSTSNNYENKPTFYTKKSKYNETKAKIDEITVDFEEWESEGTKKLFYLSPFLIDTLKEGKTLIIDEFDARLHPRLTKGIVQLFNSTTTNYNNAQLIFITHDIGLLKSYILRRDQICFVDKTKFGNSELKSLVEYRGIRNDASYDKDYMQGKYSAVPSIKNLDKIFIK